MPRLKLEVIVDRLNPPRCRWIWDQVISVIASTGCYVVAHSLTYSLTHSNSSLTTCSLNISHKSTSSSLHSSLLVLLYCSVVARCSGRCRTVTGQRSGTLCSLTHSLTHSLPHYLTTSPTSLTHPQLQWRKTKLAPRISPRHPLATRHCLTQSSRPP
jgi:hypothetical protein